MASRVSDLRKAIPLRVKLQSALLMAGFAWEDIITPKRIHFDHDPALGIRRRKGKDFDPPQHDARFIKPMLDDAHRRKTSGTKATSAGSDVHVIAKTQRLADEHEEFRKRVLKPGARKAKTKPKTGRAWPSRKFRSGR